MADKEFYIDSRNKLGGDVAWEDGDEFDNFVRLLNSGASVRGASVPGVSESSSDVELDEAARQHLRDIFSRYSGA
jgi:hypothetical protein